jgi:NADPH-dependent 2,4-dienoyl-CoA reductase/sulfur reductase-like enzyme
MYPYTLSHDANRLQSPRAFFKVEGLFDTGNEHTKEAAMIDFLIVGGDAAGLSAAVQIRQKNPEADIKVFNKGPVISYSACGIPYVISGDIPAARKLVHFTPESFREVRGVPVFTEQEAVGLFPEEHAVDIKDLKTGETFREQYGKLLIATGARPIQLPFLDYSSEGVFNVHTIPDLERILVYLDDREPQTAAVIGAGNIGLELAEALHGRNIHVLMFEMFPEPVSQWPPLIRKAAAKKMKEKGIEFHGETPVRGLERKNGGYALKTDSGEFDADIIFSVVGTVPATAFCGDKLNMKRNGAIVTDRRGVTSMGGDIYAAGDCASVYHRLLDRNVYFPLGSTANKMGRIAGINMAGGDFQFPGIVGTQIVKFFELSLAKTGLSKEEAEKEGIKTRSTSAMRLDKAGYYPGAVPAKVQVVVEEETGGIMGAAVVCEGNAAQLIDAAAVAVQMGMDIRELGWFDAAYAPPFAPVWNALISAALKAGRD